MPRYVYSKHAFLGWNAQPFRVANYGILVERHLVFGFESLSCAIVFGLLASFNTMFHN
jgi:hypothetical protein